MAAPARQVSPQMSSDICKLPGVLCSSLPVDGNTAATSLLPSLSHAKRLLPPAHTNLDLCREGNSIPSETSSRLEHRSIVLVGKSDRRGPQGRSAPAWSPALQSRCPFPQDRFARRHNETERESISCSVMSNSLQPLGLDPLSMEFFRPEYWSGYSFPSPGNLPNPRTEPGFLALQADSLPSESPGKPIMNLPPNLKPD